MSNFYQLNIFNEYIRIKKFQMYKKIVKINIVISLFICSITLDLQHATAIKHRTSLEHEIFSSEGSKNGQK